MTPEGAIQNTILDWLAAKHILAFRMNTGAVKTGNRFFRFGVPGMADILVLPRRWRKCLGCDRDRLHLEPVWIEVKSAHGRQSEWQRSFQQQVEAEGHSYVLARSLEDVIAIFE